MANTKTPMSQRSLEEAEAAEGKRQTEKAEARASGTDRIFRFGLKQGNSAEVVILDESLDDGVHFHEHNIKGPEGYFNVFEVCPKEFYECPLCAQHGESGFVLYLSVLHLDAYKDKKTGEWRDSRSLLPIKYSQLATFKKVMKAGEKKHGKLRGIVLNLERNTGPTTSSPRIGEPVEFEETGTRFDFIEDLEGDYGHDEFKADDGTVLKKKNANITAFDYEVIFPNHTDMDACIEDLRSRYTSAPTAGSDSATKSWTDEEANDNIDTSPPKRTRSRRKSEEPEAGEAEAKPSRRRKAEASTEAAPAEDAPKTRRRSRKGDGEGWAE